MITGLHFGTTQVSGFRALLESFPVETFASPLRSTLPLLDFWRVPELRLEEFSRAIGIERIDDGSRVVAAALGEFPAARRSAGSDERPPHDVVERSTYGASDCAVFI
jgi:hypothetical protein